MINKPKIKPRITATTLATYLMRAFQIDKGILSLDPSTVIGMGDYKKQNLERKLDVFEKTLGEVTSFLECGLDFDKANKDLRSEIFNELYYIKEFITDDWPEAVPVDIAKLYNDIAVKGVAGMVPRVHTKHYKVQMKKIVETIKVEM